MKTTKTLWVQNYQTQEEVKHCLAITLFLKVLQDFMAAASTQISNNQSLAFLSFLWTVQSEISCVHHLFSVNYAFLFFVVRLRLVEIFERIAKILQFLKKIHGDYFRSYLNLFKPSQVTNVKIHTFTCYAPNIKTSIDCIQKYRFSFPKFKVKNLSLVLFYCLKTRT